jgi:pyruvate dehydrogenase E2 component (dihydrolipoamide acetyltransferase)
VEVLTDKATVEIPSPRGGRVLQLLASEGDVVAIGATILLFAESDSETIADLGTAPAEVDEVPAPALPTVDEVAPPPDEPSQEIDATEPEEPGEDIELARELARAERTAAEAEMGDLEPPSPPSPQAEDRALATPATRRLANELGIDLALVPGSGIDGRVMKEDVQAFAETAGAVPVETAETEDAEVPEATPPQEEPSQAIESVVADAVVKEVAEEGAEVEVEEVEPEVPAAGAPAATSGDGQEERVPLRGLRRTISERMVVAKQTAPHYTYVEEADMEQVVQLRTEAKAMAAEHGVKLTYLPFIVRALTMALKKHPYLNASLDEEAGEIVLKSYYNVGIATATEGGLIVPVIKNADSYGLFELAGEIQRLSTAARDGSIALEDLQGGTFTITSTGNIGGLIATPILNLPEVAILGVTAIRKRPVVRNDEIAIRHMVNLSLTLDHRVVDGAVGALFMRDLVKLLEDPKLQLLASM